MVQTLSQEDCESWLASTRVVLLGVDPSEQGKRIGTNLLAHVPKEIALSVMCRHELVSLSRTSQR